MDVMSVFSIVEIRMSSQLQLSEDKEKKISQNNLTSFLCFNSNNKGQISFLGNTFSVVFHNKMCFLITFFICPSFTEDIRHS